MPLEPISSVCRNTPPTGQRACVSEFASLGDLSPEWFVPRDVLKFGERLGKGAFGKVCKCIVEDREEPLAAKLIPIGQCCTSLLKNEVNVWSQIDHPACVKLHGICVDRGDLILLCSLCSGGCLQDHLEQLRRRGKKMSDSAFVQAAITIADALAYLHRSDIIHRDIKSSNVLRSVEGTLQISDFGLAVRTSGSIVHDHIQEHTAETGSYRWMAPEVFKHLPYGPSCDVYSFGMLCYEMLALKIPFDSMGELQAAFASLPPTSRRPVVPSHCKPQIADLLARCWADAHSDRPSSEEVVIQLQELQERLNLEQASFSSASSSFSYKPSAFRSSSSSSLSYKTWSRMVKLLKKATMLKSP
mmetsp:Transcript_73168/g.122181  ORF Transcript_73168/g.122181 Transcript_73168/m.122181 type:complete len:358 (+) Transcript_73168:81-1154(+)|eukprot:CAMPEP_0119340652 /NCGR_PEP_ID=MMETSP1333-20130426/100784_1 /TAXON_ID=418940 /ORGANISM="Scyphosphaera apsteinii, Strain RCC1455" /LENGTH=357 /DNA_ID=CAMNT_0007352455 /DNA_START=79 /DNA_END=1152 /DNA_ORIENTATION=+